MRTQAMMTQIQLANKYNVDLGTRTIYLTFGEDTDTDLDQHLSSRVVKALRYLDSLNHSSITLVINCEGGIMYHGIAIYETMRLIKSPVRGIVTGLCCSMAAWILQGCATRQMSKYSMMMVHDKENPEEPAQEQDQGDKQMDKYCHEILAGRIREKHPEFPMSRIRRLLEKDSYFTALEALELGLIDEVV